MPKAVAILRRQLKIESDNDIKVSINISRRMKTLFPPLNTLEIYFYYLFQVIVIKILCTIACAPNVDSNIIVEDLIEQVSLPSPPSHPSLSPLPIKGSSLLKGKVYIT